jgi:CRP/FNR family transcriptional regulator
MKPLLKTASAALKELLMTRGQLHAYQADEELFAVGEPAGVLPIIVNGKAKMVQFPDAGKEVIIGIFGDGEMFAVPPVIDGRVYPASAYTMEPSQILLIQRRHFFEILRDSHEFTIAVLEWLSDMLRQKTGMIQTLAGGSAEQRIAGVLIRLFDAEPGPPPIKIKLRREDIARMAGLTTETAIRTVRHLSQRGDIRIQKGKIVIDRTDALRRYLTS